MLLVLSFIVGNAFVETYAMCIVDWERRLGDFLGGQFIPRVKRLIRRTLEALHCTTAECQQRIAPSDQKSTHVMVMN